MSLVESAILNELVWVYVAETGSLGVSKKGRTCGGVCDAVSRPCVEPLSWWLDAIRLKSGPRCDCACVRSCEYSPEVALVGHDQ